MAARTATRALRIFRWKKSELIWRCIPKYDHYIMINEYKQTLKDLKMLNRNDAVGLVSFPFNSFGNYPKNILEKIINESVNTVKRNNMENSSTYNALIKSYIDNGIQFNVVDLLKNMRDNQIDLNLSTYYLLIDFYCKQGEMEAVEKLLDILKLKNLKTDKMKLLPLITGYIIAGDMEKSVNCIKNYGLNENSLHVLMCIARGHASLGDINGVMAIIDKIKNLGLHSPPYIYFQLFQLLVMTKISDSDVEPILQLMKENHEKPMIYNTIFSLNRTGYYNHSLKLVKIFLPEFQDRVKISDLITSFNSSDCPLGVYKDLLKLLVDFLDPKLQRNIFCNLTYDEAFDLAQNLIYGENCNVIFTSLMNRAISDKSVLSIQTTLEFGYENLTPMKLNSSLQFSFLPSMLKSGMVRNFKEMIDLLPQYRSTILPLVLMHNLCIGNFSEYKNLITYHDSPYPLFYMVNLKYTTHKIMQHVSFKEVERLIAEASKVFHISLVNKLMASYITEKIILSSYKEAIQDIKDAVKLAENFNVTFTSSEFETLKFKALVHLNFFQSLSGRIVDKKSPFAKKLHNEVPDTKNKI